MSTQIDLGPVLSIPKGDWDANTTYERLNMVRHNSAAWICNVATSKGVEPTEDSTDWYLQVKDTSSVTSVNGMKGDVVISLTEAETPPADDDSNRIATTEWVTDKLGDVDLSGIKEDTILAAQNASSLEVGTGELTSAEIAIELENLRTLIAEEVAKYLPLAGGTLTGELVTHSIIQRLDDFDVTATPSEALYGNNIRFTDKNGKLFGMLQPVQWSNGHNALRIILGKKDGSQGDAFTVDSNNGILNLTVGGEGVLTAADSAIIAGYAMPSNSYTSLTLGASGTSYTAPANGYFSLYKKAKAGQYAVAYSNGIAIQTVSAVDDACIFFVPALKGSNVRINYNVSGATEWFRFVYAKGAE